MTVRPGVIETWSSFECLVRVAVAIFAGAEINN